MRFLSPEWIVLIPLFLVVAWLWKPLRITQPLRIASLLLLLLILMQPEWIRIGKGVDLWVLFDRSQSAEEQMVSGMEEAETILQKTKGPHDQLFVVDYADVVALRQEGDVEMFSGKGNYTRTPLAIQHALSKMSPQRASRLLLLTDGFSTEPIAHVSERLIEQGVPLDFRLLSSDYGQDLRITALDLPSRLQPSEPFLIELQIEGHPNGEVPVRLERNQQVIYDGEVEVIDGKGLLRVTDQVAQPGAHLYSAMIFPSLDTFAGNNHAEQWVEISGGPRILLVSGYTQDPLAQVLAAQGFQVETVDDLRSLHVGQLSGAKAVIFNNVPASEVPVPFLKAIDFYVENQGGGFLMIGGKNSFGSGGYFESPVADILPVSLELRREHRQLSVAMAVVMDRSGSMGATVAGGTKMDLANEGASRTVELLGQQDAITVFAVDSTAHSVVPLSQIGSNRERLTQTIRSISSGGGGIYVYTGLKAGWDQLKTAQQGQRHVILFSDAADSEEPGAYKALIAEMVKEGASISVIGLGTESDADADFLKDIARLGNGRIFFNTNPQDLPALFAQETVAVARSAFLEDPVPLTASAGWMELAARSLSWVDTVDGYNLSYLKPEASVAASSGDEYNAPLVAFWQRGIGRSMAVSFPLGGSFSERVRAWPQYGDFIQTISRWLMGEELPEGIGLRSKLAGTEWNIDLFYNEDWEEKIAKHPPLIFLKENEATEVTEKVWERLRPGHYAAKIQLSELGRMRGVVQVGQHALPLGPKVIGMDKEWAFDTTQIDELKKTSIQSGGHEVLDLSNAWRAPAIERFSDLRPYLFSLLLILILLDALFTRTGWQKLEIKWKDWRPRAPTKKTKPSPQMPAEVVAPVAPEVEEEKSPSNEHQEADSVSEEKRRSRFDRAKRQGR